MLFYYFQGLLSTTFLVDIFFRTKETENEEEEEKKSVFVKIPLTGEAGKNFKQVKTRPRSPVNDRPSPCKLTCHM